MNWNLLLPATANPGKAIVSMFSGDSNGMSDGFIRSPVMLCAVTLL